MENSIRAKYPTKEIMLRVLSNEDRIGKIQDAVEEFKDHKQRHEEVYDKKLNRLDIVMFGEKGDNGIISELRCLKDFDERQKRIVERLKNIEDSMNKIMWVVILAVLGAILKLVIFQ